MSLLFKETLRDAQIHHRRYARGFRNGGIFIKKRKMLSSKGSQTVNSVKSGIREVKNLLAE